MGRLSMYTEEDTEKTKDASYQKKEGMRSRTQMDLAC